MNFVKKMFYGNKITELIEIGNNHLEEENYFSAISFFSQALEINNENEEALFIRASAYLNAKNYDKAQNDLEMLVSIHPDYDEETYYLLAKSCLNQNKYSNLDEQFLIKIFRALDLKSIK